MQPSLIAGPGWAAAARRNQCLLSGCSEQAGDPGRGMGARLAGVVAVVSGGRGRVQTAGSGRRSQGVGTVVMKNWEPLVLGPALAMDRVKGRSCRRLLHARREGGWDWGWGGSAGVMGEDGGGALGGRRRRPQQGTHFGSQAQRAEGLHRRLHSVLAGPLTA